MTNELNILVEAMIAKGLIISDHLMEQNPGIVPPTMLKRSGVANLVFGEQENPENGSVEPETETNSGGR